MSGIPSIGIVALTASRTDPHPFAEWCYCASCRRWAGFVALACLAGSAVLTIGALYVYLR